MMTFQPISAVVSLCSCIKVIFFHLRILSLLNDPLAELQRGTKQLWYLLCKADALLFLSSTYLYRLLPLETKLRHCGNLLHWHGEPTTVDDQIQMNLHRPGWQRQFTSKCFIFSADAIATNLRPSN